MSSFTWTPSWIEKFIKLRFQNDHLFQSKFRSWSSFRKILIKEGFPKEISTRVYNKKWSNIYQDYQNVISRKTKSWKYQELYEKYMQKSPAISRKWSTEWIKKLLEIRIEHEDIFKSDPENINQYEESWSLIERKIKDAGLPVEHSVRRIDNLWNNILKKYKLVYSKNECKGDTEKLWPYYDLLKNYCEKHQSINDSFDSDDDMEPLSKLKSNKIKIEPDYSILNSGTHEADNEFLWTTEWIESFIHLRFQNYHLFKKKNHSWINFHKLMISNGFPETLTPKAVGKKWAQIMETHRNAVLLGNKNWIHYNLIQSYLDQKNLDVFKDWPEEWIKCIIELRIKHNLFFSGSSVDPERKWAFLEFELRKAGIPNQCILRNIHLIWTSLVKKFKYLYGKRNFISLDTVWPYYHHMKEYFMKCNPKFFCPENDVKCKKENDDDASFDYSNMENEDPIERDITLEFPKLEKVDQNDHKIFLNVKNEFLIYPCRGCLQSSEQVVSLYESFDNTLLLHKFKECTNISIEDNTNYPYHLCHPCLNQLNIAYEFRRKCEQSNIMLKNSSAVDKTKIENIEIEPNDLLSEFNFDDDVLKSHYSSDDDENLHKIKKEKKTHKKVIKKPREKNKNTVTVLNDREDIKKTKAKTKKNIGKPRKRSKNVIIVPVKTESGEIIYKQRYVYKKMCEICGKPSSRMTEHMKGHSDEKTYKCEICSKTFRYRASYTTHLKTHSETPLKVCQICGKEFFRNLGYKRHLVYHANERKFSCETCGKTFNTKDILRIHIRSHTGERPYSCQICGKTFLSSGCVGRHQKVHRKEILRQNQIRNNEIQTSDTKLVPT